MTVCLVIVGVIGIVNVVIVIVIVIVVIVIVSVIVVIVCCVLAVWCWLFGGLFQNFVCLCDVCLLDVSSCLRCRGLLECTSLCVSLVSYIF